MFCKSLTQYLRRETNEALVGNIPLGGKNPIRLQSMITVETTNVDAAVEQCIKIASAGADYVRATTQGKAEAEAMKYIRKKLDLQGVNIPLIADVHFNPEIAEIVAKNVQKVRINPGNYIDKRKSVKKDLSREEFDEELQKLRKKFISLLDICRAHKTALRIGVNHGSLSERIMNRYGDTPQGMVESAMEFLSICRDENFKNVVVSMKSSNTRIMVYAYRLLVERMNKEKMMFPLHLGVTEAGEGEDGRIKSAVGIGTLLADGIGDTIRVSLTEVPENEIPVGKIIVNYFENRHMHKPIPKVNDKNYSPYEYKKRETVAAGIFGGENPVSVIADLSHINPIYHKDFEDLGFVYKNNKWHKTDTVPDAVYVGTSMIESDLNGIKILSEETENLIHCKISSLNDEFLTWMKHNPDNILMLESENINAVAELRACFLKLENAPIKNPAIIRLQYVDNNVETLQIKAACDFGALLIDGFGDAICLRNKYISNRQTTKICFGILQATRVRFSKTEYIACPGCGRTLYNIQKTLDEIKKQTSHLKHLKIAVMGCIVNGIGEMADADYGYVGAGVGKISLYKNKMLVKRNICEKQAVDELVKLIKDNKDWRENVSE